MSLKVVTNLGELTIKLFSQECTNICENFYKLSIIGFYNNSRIHDLDSNYTAICGLHKNAINLNAPGPIVTSIYKNHKLISDDEIEYHSNNGPYLNDEINILRKPKHGNYLLTANIEQNKNGSGFQITLNKSKLYPELYKKHSIFAQIIDSDNTINRIRSEPTTKFYVPISPIYIIHITVLEQLQTNHLNITIVNNNNQNKNTAIDEFGLIKKLQLQEAKTRTLVLKSLRDINNTNDLPPENVLFICRLNPITQASDLNIVFSKFGKVIDCNIVKDLKTGESLQYGFITYSTKEECEYAYINMKNAVIDNRAVVIKFSQSIKRNINKAKRQKKK